MDRHVLDEAAKRIETELAGEPALAADLYEAIGVAHTMVAGSALTCLERSVELNERARGPDDPTTLDAKRALGVYYYCAENYTEGQKILREVIESSRRVLGEDAFLTIRAIMELGFSYQFRSQQWVTLQDPTQRPQRTEWLEEAVTLLREALERSRRVFGDDDRLTLSASGALALALAEGGSYAEAEALIHETIARHERVLGKNDSNTLNSRMTLVAILYYSGRVEEAIAMGRDLRENMRRSLGENGAHTLVMEMKLGVLQLEVGRIEEAEPLLRDAARRLPLISGSGNQFSRECEQALTRLEGMKTESPLAMDR